jgi:predicted RNA binding protein YcfA (HicA-like mRNA interferase family)
MPKIPRDISGRGMAKLIKIYGYNIVKERGGHIRLLSNIKDSEHKITIPDHKQIKIGTLNNILNDIGGYLKMSKEQLVHELFKR